MGCLQVFCYIKVLFPHFFHINDCGRKDIEKWFFNVDRVVSGYMHVKSRLCMVLNYIKIGGFEG